MADLDAPLKELTDCQDLAKAAREFVERNPVENVSEKLILHMATEIESLRRDLVASNRRANALRRRISKLERV